MENLYYILEGKTPIATEDIVSWSRFMETGNRVVNKTVIGDVEVSTVFLGLNHNFMESDTPILFETMIFGGKHHREQYRYSTWEEAEEGHERICGIVFGEEVVK